MKGYMAVSATPGTIGNDAHQEREPGALHGKGVRALWSARGLWLGPLAWLISLIGTLLLKEEPGRTIGALLILSAGVLAVLAWGRQGSPPGAAFAPLVYLKSHTQLDRNRLLSLTGIVLSGVLVCLADVWFLFRQGEIFGLAGCLWLLSIGLLIAGAISWPRPTHEHNETHASRFTRPPGPPGRPVR